MKEIVSEDAKLYKVILRMTPVQFETILQKVAPRITKQNTNFRKSIGPAERLQVTLRYLATGATQSSLQIIFRIEQSTISKILKETIPAIYDALSAEFLKLPKESSDWMEIANDFFNLWGFPNCIGAIDGKHWKIKPLKKFGSNYWCCKGGHSFVLMAIADAHYRFIYADVGINGRVGDAGIWIRSELRDAIENNLVAIPEPLNLPSTLTPSPLTFLSDDAFMLTDYMMKSYGNINLTADQIRLNYMLSRNRRVVENAFGILANRFQVLFTPIFREPTEAIKAVLCCICLHNYLRTDNVKNQNNFYHFQAQQIDLMISENYSDAGPDYNQHRNNQYRKSATEIRRTLEEYFKIFNENLPV